LRQLIQAGPFWREGGGDVRMQPPMANNFNLLRLAFAMMVLVYHIVIVFPQWTTMRDLTGLLAEIGVQGFFVLSGYLVYASFENSSSLAVYIEKRLRRVYPAYAVVILICTVAALIVSSAARADLAGVARYAGWNLVFANFMAPSILGIFVDNPTTVVNASLWTLKIEVMFYLILPLLVWLLRGAGRCAWIIVVLIYMGAEAWRFGLNSIGKYDFAHQLPGQMSFFITGMLFYALKLDGWRIHVAGLLGAILFAATLIWVYAEPLRALGLGALAIWAATGFVRLPDAARFGDLSYGIYIVHFPIIQTVAVLDIFQINRWLGVGVAVTTSIIAAFLLWHLVEKPALRSDSAYRRQKA